MDALSSIHPSLNETISWLEWRLDQLEANGEIEASYALTAEHADWLLGCPIACKEPLTVRDGVIQG